MSLDPSFSFDLYPGLDAELEAAYRRNVDAGTANPEDVASGGLAAVLAQELAQQGAGKEGGGPPSAMEAYYNGALSAAERLFPKSSIWLPEVMDATVESVDWQRLEKAYDVMNRNGWSPQVILSPPSMGIKFWRDIYKNLPSTKDGGLYLYDDVEGAWGEIERGDEGRWTVSVIAGMQEPILKNVSHNLQEGEGDYKKVIDVAWQELDVASSGALDFRSTYPTLSEYLTLQALNLQNGTDPIDAQTATWLNGEFDKGSKAPCAYWGPADGRVYVGWGGPGSRDGDIGVRPAVRG